MTLSEFDHFSAMQEAVRQAQSSLHPSNKIGAALWRDHDLIVSAPNVWLDALVPFESYEKIGNASPTIHAEVYAALLALKQGQALDGARLYVTDPPCPNCIKMMICAGVREIYIDLKGFEKDWYQRRSADFKMLSLELAEQAGVSVYRLIRDKAAQTVKLERLNAPLGAETDRVVQLTLQEKTELLAHLSQSQAVMCAIEVPGQGYRIYSDQCYQARGYEEHEDKYDPVLRSLNRLFMDVARDGYALAGQVIYCNGVPTSRELVNFIGLGQHVGLNIIDANHGGLHEGKAALQFLLESPLGPRFIV